MNNEKLVALMKAKGINKTTLSSLTNIPGSTLNRIIKGETLTVKMPHMQAIAAALNTSIYSIFEIPADIPLATALRPDEAGDSVTKLLNPDESLLLYWYQNSLQEGRNAIFTRAKSEYLKTQAELTYKTLNITVSDRDEIPAASYEQLILDGI